MELTPEQKQAHDTVIDFVCDNKGKKLLTLGGYAGTGKTTTVGAIARTLKGLGFKIAFCTVSGKASTVLKSKLTEFLTAEDYCGTIHSLIYWLIGKERLKSGRTELYFEANTEKILPYNLIIVDEASMVNEWIYNDLAHYGIPILAVGDHGQLPPVKGSFNLMENPQIKLEKIMRQAEGNPIIQMALRAREEGIIKYGDYGHGCIKTHDVSYLHTHQWADLNSIALCGLNKTRVRMNSFAREILKRNDPMIENNAPIVGEPLICLYNNHKRLIFNGNIGVLMDIRANQILDSKDEVIDVYTVDIDMGDFEFHNNIDPKQFGASYTSVDEKNPDVDYFDWAYCITTHKAQGSEWNNVLIIEEGEFLWKGDLWRRWLYTAITRAKEKLVIYKKY